jgi:hypothetical protein
MNAKKAKKLRKLVYGQDNYRNRDSKPVLAKRYITIKKEIIDRFINHADPRRKMYQQLKKEIQCGNLSFSWVQDTLSKKE